MKYALPFGSCYVIFIMTRIIHIGGVYPKWEIPVCTPIHHKCRLSYAVDRDFEKSGIDCDIGVCVEGTLCAYRLYCHSESRRCRRILSVRFFGLRSLRMASSHPVVFASTKDLTGGILPPATPTKTG